MDEILKSLKTLPKEILLIVVYDLMQEGIISYAELTQLHIQHLENLQRGATEDFFTLQGKICLLWNDYKKNRDKNLKDIMQYLKDKGTIMLEQEEIDNYGE